MRRTTLLVAVAATLIIGTFGLASYSLWEAGGERERLCAAANGTRALIREILVDARDRALRMRTGDPDEIRAYFARQIARASPVRCEG